MANANLFTIRVRLLIWMQSAVKQHWEFATLTHISNYSALQMISFMRILYVRVW